MCRQLFMLVLSRAYPFLIISTNDKLTLKVADEERGLDKFVTRLEDSWAKMDGMQLQAQDMVREKDH